MCILVFFGCKGIMFHKFPQYLKMMKLFETIARVPQKQYFCSVNIYNKVYRYEELEDV